MTPMPFVLPWKTVETTVVTFFLVVRGVLSVEVGVGLGGWDRLVGVG